jgi:hypothetical protein
MHEVWENIWFGKLRRTEEFGGLTLYGKIILKWRGNRFVHIVMECKDAFPFGKAAEV